MSNPFLPAAPPTPEQQKAARLAALVTHMTASGSRQLQSLITFVTNGWDNVWENSTFTPSEILVAMGTDAAEMFRTSAIVTSAIYQIDPSLLDVKYLSAKLPYIAQEDGSIILE